MPQSRGRYSINRAGDVRKNATGELVQIRKQPRDGRAYVHLPATLAGTYSIARLLAMAFLPDPNYEAKHVHHKNGDPTDDRIDNLIWLTPSEHAQAHYEMGTRRRGEAHHKATLTTPKVREIRRRHAAGEDLRSIAARVKASVAAVTAVAHGKTWKHVT